MARDICYYDGACGMCRRTTRFLRVVDRFGRLEFRDMTAAADLPVAMEVAMTGMPMRTRSGRVLIGFPAVRRALSQTVAGPLGWVMYVPGVSQIAGAVYGVVARNRRRQCEVRLPPGAGARILRP